MCLPGVTLSTGHHGTRHQQGQSTEVEERQQNPQPHKMSHRGAFPCFFVISIPAPFLPGSGGVGRNAGMLLGFSQVLLRCAAGIHTLHKCRSVAMPGGPAHTLDCICLSGYRSCVISDEGQNLLGIPLSHSTALFSSFPLISYCSTCTTTCIRVIPHMSRNNSQLGAL